MDTQLLTDARSPLTGTPLTVAAVVVFLTTLALGWSSLRKKKVTSSSLKTPPVCPATASEFFGSFFDSNAPSYMYQLSRRMGEKVFRAPSLPLLMPPFYVVCDHVTARKCLRDPASTKFRPANQFFIDTTNGPNLVTEDGHRWKHVRKSTATAFSPANVKKMVQVIDQVVEEWMKHTLEPCIEKSESFDVLMEMNKITCNVIGEVAFDYSFSDQEQEQILQSIATCWLEFGQYSNRNILRQFQATKWMFPGVHKAHRAANELYGLCETMLRDYRAKATQQPHKIIHAIANDPEYKNDAERISDMVAFVIAGFDTTANTLSFAFYELARNPDIQSQLRRDIRQCDEGQRHQCPLLKRIVRETLRLYPAAAGGSVRELHNDIVAGDYVLPSGSTVLTAYYAIQRDPDVFENPNDFLPSRWENPTNEQLRCILAFAAGRRNCQGQALANAELHEVLAKLIAKYEFSVVEEGEPMNIILFKPVGTILSAKIVP